jgi:outer membrane protein OmpA-like peptidoglycan-associated protein
MKTRSLIFALTFLLGGSVWAVPQSTDSQHRNRPTYRVTMVPATITVINYQNRSTTEIGFQGSPLQPLAKGRAKVSSERGRIRIEAEFKDLDPAEKFGPEFLTYVLWAITPEGKANNLGEVLLEGGKSKLTVTTSLQTFGLIVTAEPYYAVSDPSDAVVLQNVTLPETTGTIQQVNTNYQLLGRGQYTYDVAGPMRSNPKVPPLELEEAQNAVEIARADGAEQYAPDAFNRAENSLTNAEQTIRAKGDKKTVVQDARDATQAAADARRIAVRKVQDEQAAEERAAQQQRTAEAQAEAAAAAAKQQQEAAAREQAERQAEQAAQARAQAEKQAEQAAQAQAQADVARQQALQQAQEAQARAQQQEQAAAQAQQAAARAEQEKEQLRSSLLQQFNRILPTTDTPRGLKVNLSDVLFDTAKYSLRGNARESLAKLSGIIETHPGLKLRVEGYTDSVGGDTYNMTLSENRANSVKAFLVNQGVDPGSIDVVGYGKSNPVASNDTAEGRQENRRVEIIISGDIIGTHIGGATPGSN